MAIDHLRGAPQLYQVNKHEDVYRMRFFSPLPLWAQRRLLLVAMNTEASNGLPTYDLAAEDLASEEAFLRNELWLKRTDNSNGEARYAPNNS
ncbi:MAG: hypothetical protein C0456_06310 [Hyphomonas sp.]|nr:hypothetical protein [Hyphomonas sp.]